MGWCRIGGGALTLAKLPAAPPKCPFLSTGAARELGLTAYVPTDDGVTVVPTCPFVVNWLEKNGESYATAGGTYRKATREDIEALRAGLADE